MAGFAIPVPLSPRVMRELEAILTSTLEALVLVLRGAVAVPNPPNIAAPRESRVVNGEFVPIPTFPPFCIRNLVVPAPEAVKISPVPGLFTIKAAFEFTLLVEVGSTFNLSVIWTAPKLFVESF